MASPFKIGSSNPRCQKLGEDGVVVSHNLCVYHVEQIVSFRPQSTLQRAKRATSQVQCAMGTNFVPQSGYKLRKKSQIAGKVARL